MTPDPISGCSMTHGQITLMSVRIVRASWLLAAALAWPLTAQAQGWDVRATGEYTRAASETADTAERFASLDAQTKLWKLVIDRLMTSPQVKALGLTRNQVSASVAGLIEPPVPEKVTRGTPVRVDLVLHVDEAAMATRLDAAHYDVEAARDLLDTWKRISQLQNTLAAKPSAPAAAAKGAKPAVDPKRRARVALQINVLLAQASAALVRQETGTTSVPVLAPGALARARTLVEGALMLDETNRDARMQMGSIFLLEEDLDEALRVFSQAVKQSPRSAYAHNKLGNVFYAQGSLPEAEKEFAEAIRLSPGDAISHSDLGETFRIQGNVPKALEHFHEAIRLLPHYMDPRHNLGITLASEQRIPEALVQFREAVRLRPSSARGHYNAAIVLADLDEDEESAKEWREAVRLNPNNYNAHYNLGEMLRLTGELADSAKEFREYVNRAPDSPQTERNKQRAMSYIKAFEEQ